MTESEPIDFQSKNQGYLLLSTRDLKITSLLRIEIIVFPVNDLLCLNDFETPCMLLRRFSLRFED